MRLAYISNNSPTTKKAHGLQIAKMCEAFSLLGHDVQLILPDRSKKITRGDYFDFYGVKKNFKLVKLPVVDLVRFGRIGFILTAFSFGLALRKYFKSNKFSAIYIRDPISMLFLDRRKIPIYFEAHKLPNKFLIQRIINKVNGVISITLNLASDIKKLGFGIQRFLVAPDGVDLEQFNLNISKENARIQLGLPLGAKIAMYSGNLNLEWKGVKTVVEAAKISGSEVSFVLLGIGDGEKFKAKNVIVVGHRPHRQVPLWLKAADILLLPNSAREEISQRYTSPLKMFEYMASRRPIIASNLSSIKEILNENNALLFSPDDPNELAQAINKILTNPQFAEKISDQALRDVENHTWVKRAKSIIEFISHE